MHQTQGKQVGSSNVGCNVVPVLYAHVTAERVLQCKLLLCGRYLMGLELALILVLDGVFAMQACGWR